MTDVIIKEPQINNYSDVMLFASCGSGIWTAEQVEGTEHFKSFSIGCSGKCLMMRMKNRKI